MTIDTLRLTAEEANDLLERGEVSSRRDLRRLPRGDRRARRELHCFLRHDATARRGDPDRAQGRDRTKGVETTAGSKILAGYVPVYDSTVAARCKARGPAVARQDEHRRVRDGLVDRELGVRALAQPVGSDARAGRLGRRLCGGRVGGPRAVGARLRHRRLDQAALRALRNVGLRPTYGTVSRYGIVAFASSLDQVGPVAKTVRDCAFLYSVIAGRDPADSTTVDVPEVEIPSGGGPEGPADRRAGRDAGRAGDRAGRRARRSRGRSRSAEELGAEVEECSLPRSVEYGLPCYYLIAPAEASSNLARYDGVRYGYRGEGDDLTEVYERTRNEGFGDEPKRRIMLGTYALSAGYYDAFYGKAQQVRTMIIREHAAVFEQFDLIVSATSPTVAFPIGERADDPLAMYAPTC